MISIRNFKQGFQWKVREIYIKRNNIARLKVK